MKDSEALFWLSENLLQSDNNGCYLGYRDTGQYMAVNLLFLMCTYPENFVQRPNMQRHTRLLAF